jgi:hypothetical protein
LVHAGQALELVCGRPLDSPASLSYNWAVVHRTEMETVIAETAERLGLLHLDTGDPEQANWAAAAWPPAPTTSASIAC